MSPTSEKINPAIINILYVESIDGKYVAIRTIRIIVNGLNIKS